jgi:hypothetical protein
MGRGPCGVAIGGKGGDFALSNPLNSAAKTAELRHITKVAVKSHETIGPREP